MPSPARTSEIARPMSDARGPVATDQTEPAAGDLRTFVRVTELGTLSAVARERNLPVSMVSRAVSRLERAYRVRLLNRSTHGLSITPEGELFLAHARRIVDSLADLSSELDIRSAEPVGLVRLSVSQVMGDAQVVPSLPRLQARHPHLRVDVLADDAMVDLVTEGIDIAVRTNQVINDTLVARHVGEYGRALYAAPAYVAAHGEPAHPDELAKHRCVAHSARAVLNRWNFRVGRKRQEHAVQAWYRANDSAILLSMTRSGLGIGRLNTAIAGPFVDRGELIEVLPRFRDPTRYPIYLMMLADRHRLPKTRAVADHLAELYGASRSY